jgi:protein SCO1/2
MNAVTPHPNIPAPKTCGKRDIGAFLVPARFRRRFSTLLLPSLLVLAGCGGAAQQHAGSLPSKSCCVVTNAAPAPELSFTDNSLYQLASSWTNDAGSTLQLGKLKGRVQVVVLFFASCNFACPILVHDLKRIEAAVPTSARNQWGITLVTIDPERDTVRALHDFRSSRGLSTEGWTLLRGNAEDTLELALLLGVKYKREGNGQFAHSNLITVLNRDGEIIYQLPGLNQDIADIVKHIVAATGNERLTARSHD